MTQKIEAVAVFIDTLYNQVNTMIKWSIRLKIGIAKFHCQICNSIGSTATSSSTTKLTKKF